MTSMPSPICMTSKTSSEQWLPKAKRKGAVRSLPSSEKHRLDAAYEGIARARSTVGISSALTKRFEIANEVRPQSSRHLAGTSLVDP
jgi:hypothetical protein